MLTVLLSFLRFYTQVFFWYFHRSGSRSGERAVEGSQAACPTHVCGLRSPSQPLSSRPAAAAGSPVTDSPWWSKTRTPNCGTATKQNREKDTKMKVGSAEDSPSSIARSQLTRRHAAERSRDLVKRTCNFFFPLFWNKRYLWGKNRECIIHVLLYINCHSFTWFIESGLATYFNTVN